MISFVNRIEHLAFIHKHNHITTIRSPYLTHMNILGVFETPTETGKNEGFYMGLTLTVRSDNSARKLFVSTGVIDFVEVRLLEQ